MMNTTNATPAPSIQERMSKLSSADFDNLAAVALYRRLVSYLRSNGWLNIITGGLTLWLGTSGLGINPLKTVQTILGIMILGQALWCLIQPRIMLLLTFAGVLFLCGIWNLGLAVSSGFVGFTAFDGLLGIVQIWWAYKSYQSYKDYSSKKVIKTAPELERQYDDIWREITSKPSRSSTDIIEMEIAQNRNWWSILLLPERAVLAHRRQKILLFISRNCILDKPTL